MPVIGHPYRVVRQRLREQGYREQASSPEAAAAVQVTPPGGTTPLSVAGLTGIAPCNFGTVDVSPLRPPGATLP